jgi:hypothetical protein
VQTKDLFDGHYVALVPHGDAWLVGLNNAACTMLWPRTYRELPDAIDAVHAWAQLLSNETEIHASIEDTVNRWRQTSDPHTLEDDETGPMTADELRTWFTRYEGP